MYRQRKAGAVVLVSVLVVRDAMLMERVTAVFFRQEGDPHHTLLRVGARDQGRIESDKGWSAAVSVSQDRRVACHLSTAPRYPSIGLDKRRRPVSPEGTFLYRYDRLMTQKKKKDTTG